MAIDYIALKNMDNQIQVYYDRLCLCSSTSGRRSNGMKIIAILETCPELKIYWKVDDSKAHWKRKITRMRPFDEIAVEPLEEQKHNNKNLKKSSSYAYIIQLIDTNQIKVGKTDNLNRRTRDLEKQYGDLKILKLFDFDNVEDAFLMEVLLHKYYKEKYPNSTFVPQDRFTNAKYNVQDENILSQLAKEITNKKWF